MPMSCGTVARMPKLAPDAGEHQVIRAGRNGHDEHIGRVGHRVEHGLLLSTRGTLRGRQPRQQTRWPAQHANCTVGPPVQRRGLCGDDQRDDSSTGFAVCEPFGGIRFDAGCRGPARSRSRDAPACRLHLQLHRRQRDFCAPAFAVAQLGTGAPFAYLACAVVIGLVVLCFAEAGSRVSLTGGPYAYVEVALGPLVGFIAGVLLLVTGLAAGAAVSTIFVGSVMKLIAGAPAWVSPSRSLAWSRCSC